MPAYYLTPTRAHIIRWARAQWPENKQIARMRLAQLRAIWHNYNRRRYNATV